MNKTHALGLSLCLLMSGIHAFAREDGEMHGDRHKRSPPSTGIFSFSLPSALKIDVAHETVTLPLYEGRTRNGRTFWYVVTDLSNQADAKRRGAIYAPKLLNALGTAAVQEGQFYGGKLVADGTVNFGLKHVLVPGPNGFPPAQFAPGARGDAAYSPLVHVGGSDDPRTVLNAPQVANATGVSGSVVAIDYDSRTVTLNSERLAIPPCLTATAA